MHYEFTGTVTEVLPTQTFGANGFSKREFRVREDRDSQWANIVGFVLKKEKCTLADSLAEGMKVNVHFNINGRIWDKGDGSPTRCFVDLDCWKIDILSKGQTATAVPTPADPPSSLSEDAALEDIPF